jgi:SSS family solute:Na+ symporter
VNSISFAVAQLLIAGVNLYLLGSILRALLGWPLWLALILAAVIVLSYITLGGLKAAIYNEVLQFFVIVASLTPLTLIGLHRVGGWDGLTDKLAPEAGGATIDEQLNSWPGQALSGFDSSIWSVVGAQDAGHRRLPEDVRPVHHDPARHDRRCPGDGDCPDQGRRDGRGRVLR